ncbi:MAG: hypothetical protein HOP10_13485 [Chitinophagaceae bacterium]|nr:hypothetical protein [Chitinophagaceae bacterium]
MKKVFFSIVGFIFSLVINAQVIGSSSAGGAYTGSVISVQSFFREGITPKLHTDVLGSPFLFENFLLAKVKLADKRVFDSIYVKLNAYDNKVHFLNELNEELQIGTAVDEVMITDQYNPSWTGAIFRSGYTNGGTFFYRVLQDGSKMQLLKKVMLMIWEVRSLGDQNKRNFQYEDQLCIAVDGTVYFENKKCGAVVAALKESDQEKARQFVTDNNLRCNKEEDMKKLTDYCNAL